MSRIPNRRAGAPVEALLAKAEPIVKPPPPTAVAPRLPEGFVPFRPNGRGVKPKKAELAVLSDCVAELAAFHDYVETFGSLAPELSVVAQACDAAGKWSMLRAQTNAFLAYVLCEESLAWKATRVSLHRLKKLFLLGAATKPALAMRCPNLAALFGVGKEIAKRGHASRKRAKAGEAAAQIAAESEHAPPPG